MFTITRKDGRRVQVNIFEVFGGGRTIRQPRRARPPKPPKEPSPDVPLPEQAESASRPRSKQSSKASSTAKTVSSSTSVFSDTITESAIDPMVDLNAKAKSVKSGKASTKKSSKGSRAGGFEPVVNLAMEEAGLGSIEEDVSEWLEGVSKDGGSKDSGKNLRTTDGEELSTQQLILLGELHAQCEKRKYIQIARKFFDRTGKHLDPKEIRTAVTTRVGK